MCYEIFFKMKEDELVPPLHLKKIYLLVFNIYNIVKFYFYPGPELFRNL